MELNIFDLRLLVKDKKIVWTEHLALRLREKNIKRKDIIFCIEEGIIIEQYPEAYPFPACLILAIKQDDEPIHAAVGVGNDKLFVITAYNPTLEKWESDYKTRKAGK